MMGWVGTVELAAHGIAIQLASLTFLVHLGLSNAATIRAGQAWGKSDLAALQKISISSNVLSGGFALVAIAVFVGFAPELLGLFMDPDDPVRPQVIIVGTGLLYVAAIFQLADAGQVQALGLLRGLQDTRVPMIMAALSYWAIGLPISYLLGFVMGLGGVGIWLGLTVGLVIAWTSMGARLYRKAFRAVAATRFWAAQPRARRRRSLAACRACDRVTGGLGCALVAGRSPRAGPVRVHHGRGRHGGGGTMGCGLPVLSRRWGAS